MDIGCEIINGNALLFSNINNDSKLKSNKLNFIMLNCTYIMSYMKQMANFVISPKKMLPNFCLCQDSCGERV